MKSGVRVNLNTPFEDDSWFTSMKALSMVSPTSPRGGLSHHFDSTNSYMHCDGNMLHSHGRIVHHLNIISDLRFGSRGLNKCLNLRILRNYQFAKHWIVGPRTGNVSWDWTFACQLERRVFPERIEESGVFFFFC